jgi:hypothetical protein
MGGCGLWPEVLLITFSCLDGDFDSGLATLGETIVEALN